MRQKIKKKHFDESNIPKWQVFSLTSGFKKIFKIIMKYGEYLLDKELIILSQLEDALTMQVDNPKLKMGEILLSLGFLTREQLQETLKNYIRDTGKHYDEVNDWVTQEEADQIIRDLKAELGR